MDMQAALLERMSEEELNIKIAELKESMGGFLTKDAAMRIMVNELGIAKKERITLAEAQEGLNRAILVAKAVRLGPVQEVGNGKKIRKILLEDNGGQRELKLWNSDAEIGNSFGFGDIIEISGVYCKNGELSMGYGGSMKVVEKASYADLGSLGDLEGETVNATGHVEEISGMKSFSDGERRMFAFTISDWKNSVRAVIWDMPERGESLIIGCEVRLEGAKVRNKELHLNSSSRLLIKRKKEGIRGVVESMDCEGEVLIMKIGGKECVLDRKDALLSLGVEVADDILVKTVVDLKKESYLGKEAFLETADGKPKKLVLVKPAQ